MLDSNFKINIAVLCKTDDLLKRYKEKIESLGVKVFGYSGLQDFEERCGKELYAGFIIDLKCILGATRNERAMLLDLEDSFPLLRVVQNIETSRISGISADESFEGESMFEVFIQEKCAKFRPRGMRSFHRNTVHLNLKIYLDGVPHLASTWNISQNGMFIVTNLEFKVGDTVAFSVKDFEDPSPIQAIVRWKVEWGKITSHLPGVGVEFVSVSEWQRREIERLSKPLLPNK